MITEHIELPEGPLNILSAANGEPFQIIEQCDHGYLTVATAESEEEAFEIIAELEQRQAVYYALLPC